MRKTTFNHYMNIPFIYETCQHSCNDPFRCKCASLTSRLTRDQNSHSRKVIQYSIPFSYSTAHFTPIVTQVNTSFCEPEVLTRWIFFLWNLLFIFASHIIWWLCNTKKCWESFPRRAKRPSFQTISIIISDNRLVTQWTRASVVYHLLT